MSSTSCRRRVADDVIYEIAISRWDMRYGFGWMMPGKPGLDEFVSIELVGVAQRPEPLRGRRAVLKLQHESFLDALDDIEQQDRASIGHLLAEDRQIAGAAVIPFHSAASIIGLVCSDRLRSVVLRGTSVVDGRSLIAQIALDTRQLANDDAELEER